MAEEEPRDLFEDEATVAVASELAASEFDEIDESDPFDGGEGAGTETRARPQSRPARQQGKIAALNNSVNALRGWRGLAIGFGVAFGLSLLVAALLYAIWAIAR